jgi:peptidyl-prolyl cis-trans isomerase C
MDGLESGMLFIEKGGTSVSNKIGQNILIMTAILFMFFIGVGGCGSKEEKKAQEAKPVMASAPAISGAPEAPAAASTVSSAASPPAESVKSPGASDIAVEIDGIKLTRNQLEEDMKKRMETLKGQIPSESLEQAKVEIRRSLVDEFVVRTLLSKEIRVKKVTATEKEVAEVLESMKVQLPAGVTMDDLLKKNNLDVAKMREEIGLNIRINKLVTQELGGKVKIADKEISDFYNKNLDKFKRPESVHARHILVAKASGDTDKSKAEKMAKAEELRKQLVSGADFAELAKKNSDCPSKKSGGDLGTFTRGQMVKPFEDAVFSQEKNAIGPVVETDFGFHIIQVLERLSPQVATLDGETKKQIQAFLESQKQQGAFDSMIKRLKAGANIVVYGK